MFKSVMNTHFTESQNHLGWKRPFRMRQHSQQRINAKKRQKKASKFMCVEQSIILAFANDVNPSLGR